MESKSATVEKEPMDCREVKHVPRLKWLNIVVLTLMHVLAVYGFFAYVTRMHLGTFIFNLVYGYYGGFGVTGGAHRLWTHRSYKAKLPLRVILMVGYAIAGMNSLYNWVRDHRVHHKYSDTDADPHNASKGLFFSHVGWLFQTKHPEVIRRGREVDMSDITSDPVVAFEEKYIWPLQLLFTTALPIFIPIYFWNEAWDCAFFSTIARWVILLNLVWSTNSFAHKYGYRPYNRKLLPGENFLLSFFVMGEGWHNYHHQFPWDYKTSELGYYMNLTGFLIDVYACIGWAYDLKQPSKEVVKNTVLKHGDGTHREWGTHGVKNLLPAENVVVSLFGMGEGWHNYHHQFPWDYKTSELGYYMNLTGFLIDVYACIGWAYDLKQPSKEVVKNTVLKHGDGTHREWGTHGVKNLLPAENVVVSLFGMGEGWHNYHHQFPWDYKTSELGYYMNLTGFLIDVYACIGWAYDLKQPSKEVVKNTVLKHGDGTHREWGTHGVKNLLPAENVVVSLFGMGEGWHNYHHQFPWDYKTSELGYYMNLTGFLIDVYACIGWAYDLKQPSKEVVKNTVLKHGDGTHREWGTHGVKNLLPAENVVVSLFGMGEGWHNYHHQFPWDYKTSELGYYMNLTGFLIDVYACIGWAYDLKQPSKEVVKNTVLKHGDGTHREWGTHGVKNLLPAENVVVSLFGMGEGWHNYHHQFPWDYKTSELGYYMNLTGFLIDVYACIGWAYDLKQPSKEVVKNTVLKHGDGTHREWGTHGVK